MKDRYDLIVVGAGPGGSIAALTAARGGLDVLLVERKETIGSPVRCAEGVSVNGLSEFVELSTRWVAARMSGASLYAPDGTRVNLDVPGDGLVLERAVFDRELAAMAAAAGAEILLGTYVRDLVRDGRSIGGVSTCPGDKSGEIRSDLVIAADGVESRLARLAGIDTTQSLHDLETCYQYGLVGNGFDPVRVELFFGNRIAPGGYAWAFAKGNGLANVGLGITGEYARKRSPKSYLDEFVEKRYPRARAVYRGGGAVPLGLSPKRLAAAGFMVVGDAARQVNSMSGAGLINAMIAGKLAGDTAVKAVKAGDFGSRMLGYYQSGWRRRVGRSLGRFYRLKEAISRLSDDTLNDVARLLNDLQPGERTLRRAFRLALRDHPRLILELRHLF